MYDNMPIHIIIISFLNVKDSVNPPVARFCANKKFSAQMVNIIYRSFKIIFSSRFKNYYTHTYNCIFRIYVVYDTHIYKRYICIYICLKFNQ